MSEERMDTVLAHARACIETAMQMRPMFDSKPQTTEKVAAHALFLRCIDHFRAAVILGEQGLEVEALSLARGICETLIVIGALLKGTLSTVEFESYDRAGKAKNARAMKEFLEREAGPDVQKQIGDYVTDHAGKTIQFEQLAKDIDERELYDGYYRMFSHVATHASMSAIRKYLDYGEHETTIRYSREKRPDKGVVLVTASAFMLTCSAIERWLGNTTPAINRAIHERLIVYDSFGPKSAWWNSRLREQLADGGDGQGRQDDRPS